MGNSQNKTSRDKNLKPSPHSDSDGQAFTSQFSLSHFVGNLSGRSFLSVTSNQSVYSASRPWSRVSRRRWHNSTLNNPIQASKTAWPVAHKESIFLPEFPITTSLQQKEFEIENTLARGAFGEVYKVRRDNENKSYALKVLSKAQIINERAVRQVKEESHIQAACGHHTFIAGSVSRWQTKKRLYIVSEYIPGGELLSLLDKYGNLPEELIKIFVAEIAIALDFLHNAGIIYRDLKPENILLDNEYHIRLIDFGLSKWLSIGARTTTLCGTLKYMAPEVLSREPYGHAVDWWSLGVVACRMHTGKLLEKEANYSARHATWQDFGEVGFPTSAVGSKKNDDDTANVQNEIDSLSHQLEDIAIKHPLKPGTLPQFDGELSRAARGLLMRLLDTDPGVRLRSLRQLQQTAYFMGFNFEHIKAMKVSPKSILEKHYPENTSEELIPSEDAFVSFDQSPCLLEN